jgi:hypothetical protein
MVDINKAVEYLKSELKELNRIIDALESMATEKYQKRRKQAISEASGIVSLDRSHHNERSFVPPPRLDPDVNLWLQ